MLQRSAVIDTIASGLEGAHVDRPNVKRYATFKSLAAAMSVLLASKTPTKNRPNAQSAAQAFREITANHHESEWIDAVPSLPR